MDERRRATSALAALVAAAALLRLCFAWRYPGFLTGDDLETIETAGKYSLGLRYTVWDIRSLFHPLAFLWAPLAAASRLGVRDPRALTWIASLPAAAFSSAAAALVYLLVIGANGSGTFTTAGAGHAALLALGGVFTAVPLMLFGAAAIRIPLATLGLIQYLAPTLQFAIGVLIYTEPMPASRLAGFALVWVALAVFTWDAV